MNNNLWMRNIHYRDNGLITIGSVIRYMCPEPIETYMRNDIPMLKSSYLAILLRFPPNIPSISIDDQIEANTLDFIDFYDLGKVFSISSEFGAKFEYREF